jgi:hypothetical protein
MECKMKRCVWLLGGFVLLAAALVFLRTGDGDAGSPTQAAATDSEDGPKADDGAFRFANWDEPAGHAPDRRAKRKPARIDGEQELGERFKGIEIALPAQPDGQPEATR